VPVLYGWWDHTAHGAVELDTVADSSNGHADGGVRAGDIS
jgi:hypothetical protein